jgi:hypothetical protein
MIMCWGSMVWECALELLQPPVGKSARFALFSRQESRASAYTCLGACARVNVCFFEGGNVATSARSVAARRAVAHICRWAGVVEQEGGWTWHVVRVGYTERREECGKHLRKTAGRVTGRQSCFAEVQRCLFVAKDVKFSRQFSQVARECDPSRGASHSRGWESISWLRYATSCP